MDRRKFLVATGGSIFTGSTLSGLTRPALGAEFEISTVQESNSSKINTIHIQFTDFTITPKYLNESKRLDIKTTLKIEDGQIITSKTANNIQFTNGESITVTKIQDQSETDISTIVTDELNLSNNSVQGSVEITVEHEDIQSQTYTQSFNITKNTIPDSTLTENLNAWYRFENNTATDYASDAEYPDYTWGDSTSYNGTVNGATYNDTNSVNDFKNGKNSGSYEFNGSSDYIVFSDNSLANLSKFTMMAWTYTRNVNNSDGYPGIFMIETVNEASQTGIFITESSNEYYFEIGVNNNDALNKSSVILDEWVHLAYTYDGTVIEEYINGSPTGHTLTTDGGSVSPEADLKIGLWEGGSDYFDGFIDDARIYNRNLTDQEIENIYNTTKP